jgi:tetratricopeptide (TPR) repeat protein
MNKLAGRTAALHIAFWQYDPWYRGAWFVWPQATALLLAAWLLADRAVLPIGKWAKPAECSNASSPGCAATQRALLHVPDEVANPTIANQDTVSVDQSAFRSSALADQRKLSAALASYYRGEFQRAIDTLKSATAGDPNVQFVTGLAYSGFYTIEQAREAQVLLRAAAGSGQRQAGTMLGRMLFIGWNGLPKDEQQGRKLIEDGAAAGDAYARRLGAIAYATGELGTTDPRKAVELMRAAADSGEPVAMAQFASFIDTGRGGLAREQSRSLEYLRRSAEAGYTEAQYALARWAMDRYDSKETDDPSEGMKWYERAYQRGHSSYALVNLARAYRFARAMPWFDTKRSFSLLQLCAPYKFAYCHYQLAAAYWVGAGTSQDLVKAYAHYTVASQLGWERAAEELRQLEANLDAGAKNAGKQLAEDLSGSLKSVPQVVSLQIAAADSEPSPWTPPSSRPAGAEYDACAGNNADAAIAACTRLISSGSSGAQLGELHYFKARSFYVKKQCEQAIADFTKAIELRGKLAWALNDRGICYVELGNLDAALADFDEAIRVDSSDPLPYANRADIYLRRNRLDQAIADAGMAVRLDPKRPGSYWLRAAAYVEKERWTDAIADATTCVGLDPKYADCFNKRAYAYYNAGKYDLALADVEELLRLEPRSTWAFTTRGHVHTSQRLFDLALADYTQAIREDGNNHHAYANRGDIYLIKEQYTLAVADTTRALELKPRLGLALKVRGLAFYGLGRLDEARIDLAAAVQQDPSWPKGHLFLALAEGRLEEKAFESCSRGNRRPDASTVVGGLPVCMKGLEFSTSLRELAEAIRLNAQYADAYAYRGYVYMRLRQREQAIADLRKALQLEPNNTFARDTLRSIGAAP